VLRTITSKSRSFVVLQLVTNVALIEYTYNFLYILIAKIFREETNSKLAFVNSERTLLHCVKSYLYYIILVNEEGDCKTRNETETKRDTTETKQDKAETKRNETKRNEKIINKYKNETNIICCVSFRFCFVSCFTITLFIN
jgi:hypothetical protein